MKPPLHFDELTRLRHVACVDVASGENDPVLAGILRHAIVLFPDALLCAVTIIDASEHFWMASTLAGLPPFARANSMCAHTILTPAVLACEDTTRDARFADNPFVTGEPRVRFYAAAPLEWQVGAVCVVGLRPRHLNALETAAMIHMAQLVSQHLAMQHAASFLRRPAPSNRLDGMHNLSY